MNSPKLDDSLNSTSQGTPIPAKHRCPHPAWAMAATLLTIALTLVGTTRATATDQAADQKEQAGRGKFMSFKDGTLTLKGNYGVLAWHNVTEKTQVLRWNDAAGEYKPAGNAEALHKVEAGAWVMVGGGKSLIRIGSRKGRTTGTFVSFKDDRLLLIGTNLGGSYVKKYGNQVHFNKFAADVPVYESIDGGDFTLVGTPVTALPGVKEGTILTIHGEGDDNITRIEIGVPKSK